MEGRQKVLTGRWAHLRQDEEKKHRVIEIAGAGQGTVSLDNPGPMVLVDIFCMLSLS